MTKEWSISSKPDIEADHDIDLGNSIYYGWLYC